MTTKTPRWHTAVLDALETAYLARVYDVDEKTTDAERSATAIDIGPTLWWVGCPGWGAAICRAPLCQSVPMAPYRCIQPCQTR
jgi:hypothetical protein